MKQFKIIPYDTTLRDGAQTPGVNLSVNEKLRILQKLDEFGFPYIEGGWPDSNPTDVEFFKRAKKLKVGKLVAFGSTIRVNETPECSKVMKALLESETEVVTIFGKSWMLHVTEALRTTGARNLEMISQSVAYLAKRRRVFYDAEHFFDGYKDNPEYALNSLEAAKNNGAEVIVLCDTNGGSIPEFIFETTKAVREKLGEDFPLGIHVHNDSDFATVNTIFAVLAAGSKVPFQVQGTINGAGERVGNVDFCRFLPVANLKYGIDIGKINLSQLTAISRWIELENNLTVPQSAPYVGLRAFCHKGGVHVSAVMRCKNAYEHVDPAMIGNETSFEHSDLGGGANILAMAKKHGFSIKSGSEKHIELVKRMKEVQILGDAQESLLLRRVLLGISEPFDVLPESWSTSWHNGRAFAHIEVMVNGDIITQEAEGDGQINAFDIALREALVKKYPEVSEIKLLHYNMPDIQEPGTDAEVVIHTIFGVNGKRWTSIAKGTNQQVAGENAIIDGYKYYLFQILKKDRCQAKPPSRWDTGWFV